MPLFGQSWFLCFWNCKKPIRFAFCHSFADAHCVFIFTCQLMHLDYKNLVTSLKSMNWTKLPLLAHIQLWPKCFPPFLRLHAFWMRPRPRPGRGQGSTVQHEGQPAESRKNWTGGTFFKAGEPAMEDEWLLLGMVAASRATQARGRLQQTKKGSDESLSCEIATSWSLGQVTLCSVIDACQSVEQRNWTLFLAL